MKSVTIQDAKENLPQLVSKVKISRGPDSSCSARWRQRLKDTAIRHLSAFA